METVVALRSGRVVSQLLWPICVCILAFVADCVRILTLIAILYLSQLLWRIVFMMIFGTLANLIFKFLDPACPKDFVPLSPKTAKGGSDEGPLTLQKLLKNSIVFTIF